MQIYYQLPVGLTDEMIWPDYPAEALVNLNAGLAVGLQAEPSGGGGPITRFIGYKLLGKPRCSRAEATAMLPLQPGDPSPFFDPVDDITRDNRASFDRTYSTPEDMVTCGPSDRPDWATPARLALLAMAGGRAYWTNPEDGLPVYFRIADITDPCPFSQDGETWETWGTFVAEGGQVSHAPTQIGEYWYRSSAVGESGYNLEISDWLPHYISGAVTVLTVEQFNAIPRE